MSNKKKKKPQHSPQHEEVLQKHALEQEEVHEVVVFFQKYSKPATILISCLFLLLIAFQFFKSQKIKKYTAADSALMVAKTPEDFQAIIDDYSSTPTAPFALIKLAQIKLNGNKIDEAKKYYQEILKNYKKHEVAPIAELGLITCRENEQLFAEAQQLYSAFAKAHKTSYLSSVALVGEARCLKALHQYSDAQIIYEDLITKNPGSTWAAVATQQLKVLKTKEKNL